MVGVKHLIGLICISLLTIGCGGWEYDADKHFDDPQVVQLAKAAEQGNLSAVDALLAADVDINTIGLRDFNPLYWLFAYGEPSPEQKAGFKYLLEKGANAMQANSSTHDTLLHFAARAEDSDYLRMILEYGEDLDLDYERDGDSWSTPLMSAILTDRYENMELLIEYGADLEKRNQTGRTALLMSTADAWKETYILLQAGADYSARGLYGAQTSIVYNLENTSYWPSAAIEVHGTDYREKVIEFLRGKGVEVNPWYPPEDPRSENSQ